MTWTDGIVPDPVRAERVRARLREDWSDAARAAALEARRSHHKSLAEIRHIGGKLPDGFKLKKAKDLPSARDLSRATNVSAVHAPDGTHLGYVGKVHYGGEDVMSSSGGIHHKVGTVGSGSRWRAFTESGNGVGPSVHFNKNRFDALRHLGRYHPEHGAG